MGAIELKDAGAILSEIVDKAVSGEPMVIMTNGRRAAVVLSFEEYERLARVPSFGRLLAAFPGEPGDLPDRAN